VTDIQLGILGEAPAGQRFGPRQQLVFNALAERTLTDDEAGAIIHADRGNHDVDDRCRWCARDGRTVLASIRRHGLVVRRRTGQWERTDVTLPAAEIETPGYDVLPEGF
jgi:hypothetical protein